MLTEIITAFLENSLYLNLIFIGKTDSDNPRYCFVMRSRNVISEY